MMFRYGIYPLTAFAAKEPPPTRPRAISPETAESIKSVTPEPIDIETRKVVNMMCNVKPRDDGCDLLVRHTYFYDMCLYSLCSKTEFINVD